ncbi:MAG: hypothetical protein AB1630_01440 [bacterium]
MLLYLLFAKPTFAEDIRWGFLIITGGVPGSSLPSQIPPSTITTDNSNAFCYPNPYRKNEEGQGMFIYSLGAIIKIYTIAGELIAEIDVEKCPEIWEVPENIASGIYIYNHYRRRRRKENRKDWNCEIGSRE